MAFEEIKKEFETLKIQLADPKIGADPGKLKTVSQRYSQLEPVLKKITEHEEVQRQLAEARQTIAEETDSDLLTIAQQDLDTLCEREQELAAEIKRDLTPVDPLDTKNSIMEIRAGAGGDEAALFAADLFRMYSRFAERQ